MEGRKDDSGKARWDLLPFGPLDEVVQVLTFGAQRYGDNNWRDLENPEARYFAAAMRHLSAWQRGTPNDADTGASHLAHAVCCLLFIMGTEEMVELEPDQEECAEVPGRPTSWVCNTCGENLGRHPAGDGATWHYGLCETCESIDFPVTEAMNFGYLRKLP